MGSYPLDLKNHSVDPAGLLLRGVARESASRIIQVAPCRSGCS